MTDKKTPPLDDDRMLAEHAGEEAAAAGGVLPGFERVRYGNGETIFEEKDSGDAAYLIVGGHVEVRKGMHSSNPQTLAKLGRGDVFGELAMFDDSPRMAEAIARSPVEAIRISRGEFLKRLNGIDPVMKAIVLYMVKRVRTMADDKVRKEDPDWGNWSKDK